MSPSFFFAAVDKPLIAVGPLDIVIIAIYFVVVLGIGIYLKRYVSTGEDFFMAGRKMTAWVAGLSFISANLSSLETMGWSAMAYQYGMLCAHAYLIGAIPAILFSGDRHDAVLLVFGNPTRCRNPCAPPTAPPAAPWPASSSPCSQCW